jgi:hypothetical protein
VSVEFCKLWTDSTVLLPQDEMMLRQLLKCLNEELAPLIEWTQAADERAVLTRLLGEAEQKLAGVFPKCKSQIGDPAAGPVS